MFVTFKVENLVIDYAKGFLRCLGGTGHGEMCTKLAHSIDQHLRCTVISVWDVAEKCLAYTHKHYFIRPHGVATNVFTHTATQVASSS
jgi:hypothetical protein